MLCTHCFSQRPVSIDGVQLLYVPVYTSLVTSTPIRAIIVQLACMPKIATGSHIAKDESVLYTSVEVIIAAVIGQMSVVYANI